MPLLEDASEVKLFPSGADLFPWLHLVVFSIAVVVKVECWKDPNIPVANSDDVLTLTEDNVLKSFLRKEYYVVSSSFRVRWNIHCNNSLFGSSQIKVNIGRVSRDNVYYLFNFKKATIKHDAYPSLWMYWTFLNDLHSFIHLCEFRINGWSGMHLKDNNDAIFCSWN